MGPLQKLESQLDDVFNKKMPYHLPENSKKSLAGAMWIIALVFGILQLWAVVNLWRLGHLANELADWANELSVAYGDGSMIDGLGPIYYLSVVVLVADAALLLMAVPGLRAHNKLRGWNFLFYGLLLNLVYTVVRMFSSVGGGPFVFFWGLVSFAIGAYLLFQIRSYFNGIKPVGTSQVNTGKPTATTEEPTESIPPKPAGTPPADKPATVPNDEKK